MIGRTIREEDVQHGGVCWFWSLSDVNKQGLCVWYCTTVSDYMGRPNREETKDPQFLDRWHTRIHTQDTRQGTERVRSFIWHFVCHWGSQGTHMYTNTHTHTHTCPLPMSDWAGERGPLPTSGKNPHHPKVKMCQLKLKKRQPLSTATDPSTSPKPRVQLHLGMRTQRGGSRTRRGHKAQPRPSFTSAGTGELNDLTPFHRIRPPFFFHLTLKKCNIPSLGCVDCPPQRLDVLKLKTWNVSFCVC